MSGAALRCLCARAQTRTLKGTSVNTHLQVLTSKAMKINTFFKILIIRRARPSSGSSPNMP